MLKTGFSTSACAAASAVAALKVIWTNELIEEVTIDLLKKRDVTFALKTCQREDDGVLCGVIKDAGDDPDVTHGIEIQAFVRRTDHPGITILGGIGVGLVTLPGLPVEPGEHAINPGPRRLILRAFRQALEDFDPEEDYGYEITIRVPEGELVAQQTMNPKLGIVGGISILGTDGIVHPYSAAAFRASVYYELQVAKEKGLQYIGIATGKRSTEYLEKSLSHLEGFYVLDVGDELGFPMDQALKNNFKGIFVGGMIGKLSKVAQGRFQTHVEQGEVDFDFLASLAAQQGAPPALCEEIRIARTARAVQNLLKPHDISLEPVLTQLGAEKIFKHCKGKLISGVFMYTLDGALLASAIKEPQDAS